MRHHIITAVLSVVACLLVLQMSCDIRRIRARLEAGRYCTRCHLDQRPLWNKVNGSTVQWIYSSPVRGIIWNPSNPSSDVCSQDLSLNYAPDGAILNTAPDTEPNRFNPSCWTCHGDAVWGFRDYTGMAHGSGWPVTYGTGAGEAGQ